MNPFNLIAKKNYLRRRIVKLTREKEELCFELMKLSCQIGDLVSEYNKIDRQLFEHSPGVTKLKPTGLGSKKKKVKKKPQFTQATLKELNKAQLDELIAKLQIRIADNAVKAEQ